MRFLRASEALGQIADPAPVGRYSLYHLVHQTYTTTKALFSFHQKYRRRNLKGSNDVKKNVQCE